MNDPNLNSREDDVADPLLPEEQVDKLVHVGELELSVAILDPNLSVIVQQRLQVLVAVQGRASKPEVVGSQGANVSEKRRKRFCNLKERKNRDII